jgi:starvation-inducible outer membrane lipoprotein
MRYATFVLQLFVGLALLQLSGCSTIPKAPETVHVPVYVSCVGDRPTPPEKAIPLNDSVSEQVRAMLIDKARLEGYVAILEAVIDGCI